MNIWKEKWSNNHLNNPYSSFNLSTATHINPVFVSDLQADPTPVCDHYTVVLQLLPVVVLVAVELPLLLLPPPVLLGQVVTASWRSTRSS